MLFQGNITLIIKLGKYIKTWCKVCSVELSTTNTTQLCHKHYIEQRDTSGENNPFFGKKHSEETIEKIRQRNLGKKPVNTLKVIVNDILYESFTEASKALNCTVATIRNRCNSDKFPNYVIYQEV